MLGLGYVQLICYIIIVYILCRTFVRLQLNRYQHERMNDSVRREVKDKLLNTYEQEFDKIDEDLKSFDKKIDNNLFLCRKDFSGLNERICNLEHIDERYKKKVDALVVKAGFGL